MSQYNLQSLYDFLLHTPEKGLRGMFVDPQNFTEVHFQLLLKVVKTSNFESFCKHFDSKDFPKIKMGPAEQKIKDKFWEKAEAAFNKCGLLTPAHSSKAA